MFLLMTLIWNNSKSQISIPYSIGVLGNDLLVSNISNPITLNMSNCIQVTNGVTKFTSVNNEFFVNNCVVDINYSKISIQVFPNPFVDAIYVSFKSKVDNDNHFKISVFNNVGQLVKVESVSQDLFYTGYRVVIPNLPTGVYFMQISSSKVNEYFKIVKND
jgi:hypothetical protein